jgi:hypothetical protein
MILAILLQILAPFYIISPQYSDDFSGSSLASKWVEYDPSSAATVTVGSGVLTVAVTGGTDHDWYTGIDNACRIRQTYTGSTNWIIEAKFTTTMTAGYQFHGLTAGTDNNNGIRWDIVYDVNTTQYIDISHIDAGTYTGELWSASSVTTQPYYLRLEKNGTTYTFKYGSDGSSWTTAGTLVWTGTINQIGVIVGNAGGGSTPAFTTTVDSFTYTAQ